MHANCSEKRKYENLLCNKYETITKKKKNDVENLKKMNTFHF